MSWNRDTALDIWCRMLSMRRFEEAAIALHAGGHLTGHYHVYIGQEATGAAVIAALQPGDLLFSTHRNHGHYIARGGDPARGLAELLGRATGVNSGMAGTLHLCDPAIGMPHTSAIVGGAPPAAVGAAFEFARRKSPRIAVAFFGDGALEEGLSIEAINLAALWKLPVLFVCENNGVGAIGAQGGGFPGSIIGTERLTAIPESYAVTTMSYDGTHAEGLYRAALSARTQLLAGKGPVFIEAVTRRWAGSQGLWPELVHGPTDVRQAWQPDTVSEDAASDWVRTGDPLMRLGRDLLAAGWATAGELSALDERLRQTYAQGAEAALGAPWPDPSRATSHVFAEAER